MPGKRDDERHRYGRHYTPEPVASLLAAFAVRSADDTVLDPSCGDGRLMKAALDVKESLALQNENGRHDAASTLSHHVFGFDLTESAVKEAAGRFGANVAVADFFDTAPGSRCGAEGFQLPAAFDSIVGNPPYIRQEIIGAEKKERLLGAMKQRRSNQSDDYPLFALASAQASSANPVNRSQYSNSLSARSAGAKMAKWSARSDIYVYFFAHAERFLKQRGRLVFITASSWLDVGYGIELRRFLLDHFRIIGIIESAAESFFEDASVNTAITVLEKDDDAGRRGENQVRFIQLRRPLSELTHTSSVDKVLQFARELESGLSRTDRSIRIRIVEQSRLASPNASARTVGRTATRRSSASDKSGSSAGHRTWGRYLRAEDVFFRILDRSSANLRRLAELGSVRFGVKTGANDFFYVSGINSTGSDGVQRLADVASVRRGVTTGANEFFYLRPIAQSECGFEPPGSATVDGQREPDQTGVVLVEDGSGNRFRIERSFLEPVIFSLKEIPRVVIEPGQTRKLLFNCSAPLSEIASVETRRYIEAAESEGTHLRPTCRSRNPWYSVLRGMKPAPLIFPSKVGERWLVAINKAGVYEDKKLYGVFPADGVALELLAALLNSTWVRYYVEATCRQLTGAQAIADIDVAVAEQVLLPDPRTIGDPERTDLIEAFNSLCHRTVGSVFDEVSHDDRRALDDAALRTLGFIEPNERSAILDELYKAATELVRGRLDRSKTGASRKRANKIN